MQKMIVKLLHLNIKMINKKEGAVVQEEDDAEKLAEEVAENDAEEVAENAEDAVKDAKRVEENDVVEDVALAEEDDEYLVYLPKEEIPPRFSNMITITMNRKC